MIRVLAMLFGLFSFALIAIALLMLGMVWLYDRWCQFRDVPRRGLAAQAWVRGPDGKPVPFDQGDVGDETKDIATEGLGWNVPLGDLAYDRIQVRRSDRRVEKHHPLGHRTTHLAYLHQDEWNLWRPITLAVRR